MVVKGPQAFTIHFIKINVKLKLNYNEKMQKLCLPT